MSQLFASGGQSIGVSASASVLPMNIQDWFPLGWTGWISLQLQSQKLLQFKNLFTHKMCTRFSAPSVQAAAGAPWIIYCFPTLILTCKTLQHANKQVSESKHRGPCKLKEFAFSWLYLSTVQMFTCPIHVLHIPDLCLSSLYFKIEQINAAFQEISWVMASQPFWHGLDPLQPSLPAPSKPSAGAPQSLLLRGPEMRGHQTLVPGLPGLTRFVRGHLVSKQQVGRQRFLLLGWWNNRLLLTNFPLLKCKLTAGVMQGPVGREERMAYQ